MLQQRIGERRRRIACALLVGVAAASASSPRAAAAQPDTAAAIDSTAERAVLADSVRMVARWLVANGAPARRAESVADVVMRYARLRALDPLLIVGVIGVENATLTTHARSRAGARGVMQVMPSWKKDIKGCGTDMHDVRVNVCLGTAVLRIALDASDSVREALLRYNGCVRAPGCHAYASAVFGRAGYALLMTRAPDRAVERPTPERTASAVTGASGVR